MLWILIAVFTLNLLLFAAFASYAIFKISGGKQLLTLVRHTDSLMDRLQAQDWKAFHAARMDQERQRTHNAALAFQGPRIVQEEREIHGF